MARYSEEEKRLHLDRYEVSGKCKTEYARENNIPEATFRTWVKEATYANYGMVEVEESNTESDLRIVKPIIFSDEKIRIELKQGYNKEFLKKIIEVLINDK